jgi:4-hydroxy-tetrahydrodipicolinate reductase
MIKIGVVGATGRTGKFVVEAVMSRADLELCAALVSSQSKSLGAIVPGAGVSFTDDINSLATADVVVDFSTPETSLRVAEFCAAMGIPVLIATTGHSPEQVSRLSLLGSRVAVGLAPNTSVGAAALTTLASRAKELLGPSFDIEVLDIHHRMKKDAPSGTAKSVITPLAEDSDVVFGREGLRRHGEVGVVALRGGDVVGDHTVYFLGDGERIEITHRVSTRAVFGNGAVSLALKLIGMGSGIYSARDLIARTAGGQG